MNSNAYPMVPIFTAGIATNHRAPIVRFVTLGAYPNFVTLCINKMPNWFSNHRSWNLSNRNLHLKFLNYLNTRKKIRLASLYVWHAHFFKWQVFIVKIMLQEPWWLNQLDIFLMQMVTKFKYVLNVINLMMGALWLVANLAVIIVIFTASIATNRRAPIVRFVTLGAYPDFVTLCIDKMPNWFSYHRSWNFSCM